MHKHTHIQSMRLVTNTNELTSETPVCGYAAAPLRGPEHLPPQWNCFGSCGVVWDIGALHRHFTGYCVHATPLHEPKYVTYYTHLTDTRKWFVFRASARNFAPLEPMVLFRRLEHKYDVT